MLEELAPSYPEVIALTGAGGKTTIMLRLAREAAAAGKRVLVTVTTKMYPPEGFDVVYAAPSPNLAHGGALGTVWAEAFDETTGKLLGVDPDAIPSGFELVLVEADGSAHRPLTAPRDYEPVIPPSTTTVLAVAGMDALGQPVSAMHRPEVIAQLADVPVDALVTPRVIATVLSHPLGNTKGRPAAARVIYLLNKARLGNAAAVAALLPGPALIVP